MQLHEILDRFEILYPENTKLGDLRRAYIDKDLYSIFRLVGEDNEDLRKFILEDNIWSMWKLLHEYSDTHFVAALKNFTINNITIDEDCFSRGQLTSKQWAIHELSKLNLNLGIVFLCAGWYATLATMIFESKLKVDKIRSFDIDESCISIAEVFNKPWFVDNWRFKSISADIHDIDYSSHTWQFWSTANNRMSYPITDSPDTIINTSCEHIENFKQWYDKIPAGKLVLLQNNNFLEIKDHVNCVKSKDEFASMSPMSTVLYEGELPLEKYTRFMRIGIK